MILMLIAPAALSLFLFERFKGHKLSIDKRIGMLMVFALVINMIVYAAIWLRGWDYVAWTLDDRSVLTSVPFCLKYIALSLVFAVAIPFALSLVKVTKRNEKTND